MNILPAIALLFLASPAEAKGGGQELLRHRSKGIALYEGVAPDGPLEQRWGPAAEEFEQAFKISRDSRDRFNWGLALLRQDAKTRAKPELEAVARARPDDPAPLYALAILAMGQQDWQGAVRQLDAVLKLDPEDPAARFQRGWVLHDKLERSDEAKREFEKVLNIGWTRGGLQFVQALYIHAGLLRFEFVKSKDPALREQMAREFDLFQRYSAFLGIDKPSEEQLREGPLLKPKLIPARVTPGAGAAGPPTLVDVTAQAKLLPRPAAPGGPAGGARVVACDVVGDPRPELFEFGAGPLRMWVPQKKGRYADGTQDAGLSVMGKAPIAALACADYDNDGDTDLFAAGKGPDALLKNDGGRFVDVTKTAGIAGDTDSRDAAWFDVDADGDLDLYVATAGRNQLWENGGATFKATGAVSGLTDGDADSHAVVIVDHDGDNDLDLLVANAAPWTFLMSSLREGKFAEVSRGVGIADDALRARGAAARDLNGDGAMDLLLDTASGARLMAWKEGGYGEIALPAGPKRAVAADLSGAGRFDLVRHDGVAAELWTAKGDGAWDKGPALPAAGAPISQILPVDADRDGDEDLVVATPAGLRLWDNATKSGCHWLRVKLSGARNNKSGVGATVELKAGAVYSKRVVRAAETTLRFGAGGPPDVLRVTWPNGILQNVIEPAACGVTEVVEAKAQGGSCPFLYAWDGERMGFIGDVLGAAPLGIPMGAGKHLPQDPTELVLVEGSQLKPDAAGKLRLVVTEELREEVTYLDQTALEAVDHPKGTRVVPNERYAFPPGPEDRLFAWPIDAQRPFKSIRDTFGNDVTADLAAVDGRRVQGWIKAPDTYRGLVEEHAYELDPGDLSGAKTVWLISHGWVFWGGGATARSTSQDPAYGFGPVKLQVWDEAAADGDGGWVTAIGDIGFPAGKSRYMPVDLSEALAGRADARFRIVTNVRLTWDAFELVVDPPPVEVRRTRIQPARAELSWLGFPERVDKGPMWSERFDYHRLRPAEQAPWNQAPGKMTKYGDVRPLLTDVDDRFVIFGAGDQLQLDYDGAELPALGKGQVRDWLVALDGYNKDGDFNNGWSQQVGPLPFHGMSAYPYPPTERYPDGETHRRYQAEWNTRDARVLVPSLANR